MNIKKLSGSLAVAISMFAINSPALAECDDLVYDMKYLKERLGACSLAVDAADGAESPVWQKKKDASCVVNERLIAQLDAPHKSPPKGKGKNESGSKDEETFAKGAINEFLRGNYVDAEGHLWALIDGINAAKPLDSKDPRPGKYRDLALEFISRINETEGGCYY
jgi:hypothetical protein